MLVDICCCPFCRSDDIYIENWSAGSSWYCKNCKREFLVQTTQHGPRIESGLVYENLLALYKDSIKVQQHAKPHKNKPRKRKKKKSKRRR
jgi:transposase-like protein